MSILNPQKALRGLPQSPTILKALLASVSQQQAIQATDGEDGWSVLYIICHLRDYEDIFGERIRWLLEQDEPTYPFPLNNDELIEVNQYGVQDLQLTFGAYIDKRRALINRLKTLTPEQWERSGTFPTGNRVTVVEMAVNIILHDHNHIEQIVRALGLADQVL